MSAAAHSICPNYYRCNKYLPFTRKLDYYEERDRKHLATIAAQAKRIAELEAIVCGGDGDEARPKKKGLPEKPFGSSTPSSRIPIKPNAEEEAKRRRGGGSGGLTPVHKCQCISDGRQAGRLSADLHIATTNRSRTSRQPFRASTDG